MNEHILAEFAYQGIKYLHSDDPALYGLLAQEYRRQNGTLAMVAASSIAHPSVLICEGLVAGNVTTEGYPGARFHAGCQYVDQIEHLAVERAKAAFRASYANVQPHSGSSANEIVMFGLLEPGDRILGLNLNAGGHLTHGAKPSVVGRYFNAVGYGLDGEGLLDYGQVRALAHEFKPKLIISGASSYPRSIDFKLFREIADEVGAFLLADVSHIAGLIVAGEHPSPVDEAHFTTTSTYKQLYGPRGGLILMGKDFEAPGPGGRKTLAEVIQQAVFPFFQGTPNLNAVAAKARALHLVQTPEFKQLARRIVENAKVLAEKFAGKGYRVLTGGTDNHLLMIDVLSHGVTGVVAERALEECDIIINKNVIPNDTKSPAVASGIRLGTNSLSLRGMGRAEMEQCADLVDQVLSSVAVSGDREYELGTGVKNSVRDRVAQLCKLFPIPHYPGGGELNGAADG